MTNPSYMAACDGQNNGFAKTSMSSSQEPVNLLFYLANDSWRCDWNQRSWDEIKLGFGDGYQSNHKSLKTESPTQLDQKERFDNGRYIRDAKWERVNL